MTGEKLAWFRVASHLHIPVEELAERITYREFVGWQDYFEWELNFHSKLDHYLAQIATQVTRSVVKEPRKVSIKDFLIKFIEDGKETKADKSKSVWMSIMGFGKKYLPPKGKK